MNVNNLKNSILLVNKTAGKTSYDIIRDLKKLLYIKKIGHSGTLDKFASGLLIICTGQATKFTRYFLQDDKSYIGEVRLGVSTDTNDIEGKIIEKKSIESVKIDDIQKSVAKYKGEILQIPPLFSALKVKGRRASDLAREGREVDLKERKVTIYSIQVNNIDIADGRFTIKVSCSKGTYIRSIARDIGKDLGTGAYLESLTRISSGIFSIDDAVTLNELEAYLNGKDINKNFIKQPFEALSGYNSITINNSVRNKVFNGTYFSREDIISIKKNEGKTFLILDEEKNVIAIADIDIDIWHIKYLNVFNNLN